jgi:hypothetical protein
MNIEANRRTFLDALRSGKYTQTTRQYRSRDSTCHCALGVGIDALGLWDSLVPGQVIEDALGEDWLLFDLVTQWNDRHELTFDEIADLLQARWSQE